MRAIKPVITLLNKMGTKDWIFKGTKLIKKYQKSKIKNLKQRLESQKYNIKNKTKQNKITKIIKNIYEICFKNGAFLQVIVGYKNEN